MYRSLFTFFASLLLFGFSPPLPATDIHVQFETVGNPLVLRLNQGSNGWSHPGWSQFYNDIGVQYRRADHTNNAYGPVRRRPDGHLWYDYAALDESLYQSSGGFSFKIYPTVDYSPACLTTELLQNPLIFQTGTSHGCLTPAGTLLYAGTTPGPNPADESSIVMAPKIEPGMYEIDRKGTVLARYPFTPGANASSPTFFATPSNHVVCLNPNDSTYSVLGPGPARRVVASGKGTPLQEIDDHTLLVQTNDAKGSHAVITDLSGKTGTSWDMDAKDSVLWTKAGLIRFDHTACEVDLIDDKGTKKQLQKTPNNVQSNNDCCLAANPRDQQSRFYVATESHVAGDDYLISIQAYSAEGQPLWKNYLHSMYVHALGAGKNGLAVLTTASGIFGVDQTGTLWKANGDGQLNLGVASAPGLETFYIDTFQNAVYEFDLRTGQPVWRYENFQDQSDWISTPPKNNDEWQDVIAHDLRHYNKDLGLGWDRWEVWNEPGPYGYFWKGSSQEYAALVAASLKGKEQSDPSVTMDAFGAGEPWYSDLIKYFNDHQVHPDGFTFHLYRAGPEDADVAEEGQIKGALADLKTITTPGKPVQLANSEWNVHPGQGDDLSKNYETGYYRAPFQSEMVYLMNQGGFVFQAEFAMVSQIGWPCGWVYTSLNPVGGATPPAGQALQIFTPAYNAARLWAMLPQDEAAVTNNYVPQVFSNNSAQVHAIAATDPARGEYGVLVWNFGNHSPGAKDETVKLNCSFKNESQLYMRHFVIDEDHSSYTKDFAHQYLEVVDSGTKSASELGSLPVTLKKDSLHAFFFTRDPLKANAGKSMTVEAHHPVQFDGSGSTGMPAFYRWDTGISGSASFPDPTGAPPSASHLYGEKPILAKGYDKPGIYTVTLRVSADGYHKVTDAATTTVTVVSEKTAPEAPQNLSTNCTLTDHRAYLQWDSLNFARNPDVAGFTVYRKDGSGGWKKLASQSPGTAYVDSGVAENVPYSYRVTAFDSSGNEGQASPESAITYQPTDERPKSPVRLKAAILGNDVVKLDWENDNLGDAARITGFNVYRRQQGGGWQKLNERPTWFKRYYDDVTANPGMASSFEYQVTSVDALGNESLPTDAGAPAPK